MGVPSPPPAYDPLPKDVECQDCSDRSTKVKAKGPTFREWACLMTVCIVGGIVLANFLYYAAEKRHATPHETGVAVRAPSEVALLQPRVNLNPFKTFKNLGVTGKVGLLGIGVTSFMSGLNGCDDHKYATCVAGILFGLLFTAAGLWAPARRRGLGTFEALSLPFDQFDDVSTHPAHRFIGHYLDALELHPEFAKVEIKTVQYNQTAPGRHRLVVQPTSSRLKQRGEDGETDDGNSVSYEWTDFGGDNNGVDMNKDDYGPVANGIAGYLEENQANNICLTQCHGEVPYEVGQLQTQAGTHPNYDSTCEFSDDMVSCH